MEILRKIFKIKPKKIKEVLPTVENKNFVMQGGVRNYLGKTEEVNNAPRYWQSFHTSPKTELCYITDAEKKLLLDANLHGSLKNGQPNVGASGLLSYDGGGYGSESAGTGGNDGFGGGMGNNNKSKPKAKKSYSILSNFFTGLSKMVTAGRKQNADVKANNALFGTSDYQGDVKKADFSTPGNDGDGRNTNSAIPLIAATAPTTAEVSQATATDATNTNLAEDAALRKKKAKATGRSMTILTSSKGVTSDQGLTLGKKSLLGA